MGGRLLGKHATRLFIQYWALAGRGTGRPLDVL